MDIKIIHDFSPQQLRTGFWQGIDGFFFASFWFLNRPNAHDFVRTVALSGGLKSKFGIDESVIYEHGSDRPIQPSAKDKKRMFLRPPIVCLREAVCFKPDVIQVMDLPLEDGDDENRICEKLAINRDIVGDYALWLVKHGFRSSSCYKNGVAKFSPFMLLGVCHGDYPGAYAEEAKFMMKHVEVIGLPIAGLLSYTKGSSRFKYGYIAQILSEVLDVIGNSRVVQLMGFGMSNFSQISRIVALAKKYDASLWIEGSTVIRNSTHARKVISLSLKMPDTIGYVNVSKVQGAEKFTPLDIFRENNKVLKGILTNIQNG